MFRTVLALDGKTINLLPLRPFAYGEQVTVEMKTGIRTVDGSLIPPYSFSFYIHREYTQQEQDQIAASLQQIRQLETGAMQEKNENAPQSGHFTVTINTNPAAGDVFFGNDGFTTSYYKYIIENNGTIDYSLKGGDFWDWRINQNNYLTDFKHTSFEMLDSNYVQLQTMGAINGYPTDIHECQIFPDGHYFVIGDDTRIIDMTVFNPNYQKNANVTGNVIQEFDANHNLLFEWNSFDHIIITEAPHENLAASFIDPVHMNALEQDADGNLIVSCRHLDQVFKLNLSNSNFIWRLGGDSNQFTFTNDPATFNYQHDVRRLANGDITIFDNNDYGTPPTCYAKEYKLDEVNKKATLVWSYAHPLVNGKAMGSQAMGNIQRLSNGNTLISWGYVPTTGGFPNVTEIDANNNIVWELQYKGSQTVYRAHRFEWTPCARPSGSKLTTSAITATSATLNWNAASGAVKYLVEYRKQGTTKWKSAKVASSNLSHTFTNLLPGTIYEWNMQTWCTADGSTKSGFTAIKTFTTLASRLENVSTNTIQNIQLYPNPASGMINIHWDQSDHSDQNAVIEISDLTGRIILQQETRSVEGANESTVDLNGFSNGIYFITIKTDYQIYKSKFEKE